MARRLVLLGGGHAHALVLKALARLGAGERPADLQVTLVSPYARQLYSGMLPGHLAGQYDVDEFAIALPPLCAAAGVEFIEGAAAALDASARTVRLADGRELGYEWLSLATGGVMDRDAIPGAREHALFLRPLEQLVQLWPRLRALAASRETLRVVMVGGGAAGTEVAMAMQRALPRTQVTVVTGAPVLLPGFADAVRRRCEAALAARGIVVRCDSVSAIEADRVRLAGGETIPCDAPVMAIGNVGPPWLRASGLALDAQGFVRTGPTLASVSHPEVHAAGDVATRDDVAHARSGVYAVRAGPALAANLLRAARGEALREHCPRLRSLYLLNCADGTAIASWGDWASQGRAWWWLKDWIDRRFIRRVNTIG